MRDGVGDRGEHLAPPLEEGLRLGPRVELHGSDHPVRRRLEGDVEGHLVHPMRGSLVLGEGGQRIGVGDGDDQVVGVEGLDPRRSLEGRTPIGRRPADIGNGHGLALVEEVEEPAGGAASRPRAASPR